MTTSAARTLFPCDVNVTLIEHSAPGPRFMPSAQVVVAAKSFWSLPAIRMPAIVIATVDEGLLTIRSLRTGPPLAG